MSFIYDSEQASSKDRRGNLANLPLHFLTVALRIFDVSLALPSRMMD
jgi:hypothetical protein